MARRLLRAHMVSIRLTEAEERFLRARAEKAGCSVSDMIRDLIAQETALPMATGESIGSPHRFVEIPGGLAQVGVFWPDGTMGGTFTTQMLTEAA